MKTNSKLQSKQLTQQNIVELNKSIDSSKLKYGEYFEMCKPLFELSELVQTSGSILAMEVPYRVRCAHIFLTESQGDLPENYTIKEALENLINSVNLFNRIPNLLSVDGAYQVFLLIQKIVNKYNSEFGDKKELNMTDNKKQDDTVYEI